jgi:hypothetical protein
MAANGCEEVIAGSDTAEKLGQETSELEGLLRSKPKHNETDKEKIREWVVKMDEAINRALCLLKLRGTEAELENAFDDFNELKDRAEAAWVRVESKLYSN